MKPTILDFFEEGMYECKTKSGKTCAYPNGSESEGVVKMEFVLDCHSNVVGVHVLGTFTNSQNETFHSDLTYGIHNDTSYQTSKGGVFKGAYEFLHHQVIIYDKGFSQYAGKFIQTKVVTEKTSTGYRETIYYLDPDRCSDYELYHTTEMTKTDT